MQLMKHKPRKPKKFNPEAFKADVMALPPHEAADAALKWRDRAMNAVEEMEQATDTALKMTGAGVFVLAVGMIEGRQQAQAEKMVEDWENGGAAEAEYDDQEFPTPWSAGEARNPTRLLGVVPWTLVFTAIPAVVGLADFNAAPYFREMAKSGVYLFLGQLGAMGGKAIRQRRIAAAAASEEEEGDEAA